MCQKFRTKMNRNACYAHANKTWMYFDFENLCAYTHAYILNVYNMFKQLFATCLNNCLQHV